MTTDKFSILYFVTVLIRGTIIKFRGHRGFNPESSSPESPVCTTAVHSHKMPREMVVYKSVWTQRHKRDQRSEISTTGLQSRRSEAPRAFAGSELSECHFLVVSDITIEAEPIEVFFRNLEEGARRAAKNLANKVANNPIKALELDAVLFTAAATGIFKAEAATITSIEKFNHKEKFCI